MYQFHCEPKNFRNKGRELENLCKDKTNSLEKMRQTIEQYKRDVERYHECKCHLGLIEMLERKRPWVALELVRDDQMHRAGLDCRMLAKKYGLGAL
ncbi:structural maintenance of chromosomes protein 5-like isoform X2 [Aptenodytes patagonicus]|uniref:structural maintenance of chromosomes protein 5-like isoform X2 n=1 Tax=Aptenodytes patagonicus TaxID=9234 RepID=UPI003F9FBC76